MSYEVISGIRYNPRKEVLSFKSHSNNDDMDPQWWDLAPKKETFNERLLACYIDMWEGNISISGYTGQALRFNYAYSKYHDYLKLHNVECSLDNIGVFQNYLDEKDIEENKVIKIGNSCYVSKLTAAGLHYTYGEDYAKTFTNKQLYLIQKHFDTSKMFIETLGKVKVRTKEEQRFYDIIGDKFEGYVGMIGMLGGNGGEMAKAKARSCIQILAEYEMVDYKIILKRLNEEYNLNFEG